MVYLPILDFFWKYFRRGSLPENRREHINAHVLSLQDRQSSRSRRNEISFAGNENPYFSELPGSDWSDAG
jgi:hypothetical protein